jgi:uncharacterized protein YndB with AHSA1/START domain
MKTMSAIIQIDAPPGAVWATLTDLGRYPEWNPLFREASGQVAVGNRITLRSVHPANGRLMTVKPKITIADPGTRLEQSETFRGLLAAFPLKTFVQAEASFRSLNEAIKQRTENS